METHTGTQQEVGRLLTEQELAEHFNVEPTLLERQRKAGYGPPFIRIGPRTIRYRPEDAVQWLADRVQKPLRAAPPEGRIS